MAIIGFVAMCLFLMYWLVATLVGFFGVGYGIAMGGSKRWEYILPSISLILNLATWYCVLQDSPITLVVK